MIYIKNDRSVFPNNVKVSNQYENETRTIQFDLSDVQFTGNTYLVCKYQNNQDFYAPLLLDSNFSIPVETFLSAQAGTYSCVIAISTATIDENYDFSTDNPLFVSNIFTLTVDANFLTGTSTSWQLTPAAQNYFDQLIALVEKVQSGLDSGAFVGNGIQSITKISTSGLVDTYQITFTNGSTFDYQVTNGQDGQTPTITIQDGYWYINGVNTGQQAQGDKGEPGDNATISVDGVTTLDPGQQATVTNTGSETNAVLAFGIPKGEKGDKGNPGQNATIAIGTVTTLEPDQEATVQNTGTETNAVLSFGIPKGAQGATGPQGPQGVPGVNENVLHADISKSENPSVDDAYEAPLQDLKMYGKSTQESTSGKNLYDPSQYQNYTGTKGMTIQYNSDEDYFILNGTCTETAAFADYSFLLKANATNYTLSCEYLSGDFSIPDSRYLVAYVGKSADGTDPYEHVNYIGTPNITKQTVQQTGLLDMPYIDDFWFYITDGVTCNNLKVRVQLEVGKTATPYEPYQSQRVQFIPPAPLYSLLDGSVADYVDVARGKYVYQLADVTFDGSEDEGWDEYNNEDSGYEGVLIQRLDMKVANRQSGFCDKLTIAKDTTTTTTTSAWLGVNNNYIYFPYANTFAGTANATEFRTWLATNNLHFIYPLATPTEQDIPSETLEALQALKTFNGVTNIFCNAPVSAQYEQSVQIVMNKILEQLNKLQTQTLNLQEEMINNV